MEFVPSKPACLDEWRSKDIDSNDVDGGGGGTHWPLTLTESLSTITKEVGRQRSTTVRFHGDSLLRQVCRHFLNSVCLR